MTKPTKIKYNLDMITRLLIKYDYLPFEEKWAKIGEKFGRTGSAAHRWYCRHRNKKTAIKPDLLETVSTDTIRVIYSLLFKKSCRIGYYLAIQEIIDFLNNL